MAFLLNLSISGCVLRATVPCCVCFCKLCPGFSLQEQHIANILCVCVLFFFFFVVFFFFFFFWGGGLKISIGSP